MATTLAQLLGKVRRTLAVLAALTVPCVVQAAELQTPVDRIDPAVVSDDFRSREPQAPRPATPVISAESQTADIITSDAAFTVGAVRVEGATMLSPADFAPAIERYLGQPLGEAELRALASDVAAVARDAGFGLATAWIPPQDVVNGILRVRLDEGRIDAVEVEGPGRRIVEPRLTPLADGRPVRTAELERRLLVAGDLAGVSIGQVRLVRRSGRAILTVATDFDRVTGRAMVDNWGSSSVGPVRLRVGAGFNRMILPGDRLTVGGVVTPFQPREYQYVQAGYSLPVGGNGTEVSVRGYFGHTDPGGALRDVDVDGKSYEAAVGLTHPLQRSRTASVWAMLDLTLRDSELDRDGVRLRNDRIVTASAGLYANGELGGGRARVQLSLIQGLDWLDATERGAPLASRRDAGGSFTKLYFWGDYTRSLGGNFGLSLSGEGQLASRPLLSSEEMGLGGQPFLRGYEFRELAGDQGVVGAAELRYDLRALPRPLRDAQLYAFIDAGEVANLDGGFGGGTLVSAGAGVRLWAEHGLEAGLQLGVPLRDVFGERPDPRLSFIVGVRF